MDHATMKPWTKLKIIFLLVEKLIYVTMISLGIFLIYKGEIIQRFQLQRTNFAVYEEAIFKLPHIVMYIVPHKNITFGKDYMIHYNIGKHRKEHTDWKMLTQGNNTAKGQTLVLNFQNLYEGFSWQKTLSNS